MSRMYFSLLLSLCLCSTTHSLIGVDMNSIEESGDVSNGVSDGIQPQVEPVEDNFIIFTVASEDNDPFLRYVRSLRIFDLEKYLQVLGLHKDWLGGNMEKPGGGYKVNLLKEAMIPYQDSSNTIVMFTDSYDVIFLGDKDELLEKFRKTGARFLISAESYLWPDLSLENQYPDIKGKKYLCSGMMMGYADTFWKILNYEAISNTDDDQLFYTHAYLDTQFRAAHKIQLDGTSTIFHNLHGAMRELDFGFGAHRITNWEQGTMPVVLHGNGPTKNALNMFGNYYPHGFDPTSGRTGECLSCSETDERIDVNDTDNLPVILTTMFINERTPFIDYFINTTFALNYPQHKWHVRVYNRVWDHANHVQELVNYHVTNNPDNKFASFKLYQPKETAKRKLMELQEEAMYTCAEVDCGWYFAIDSVVTITDNNLLTDLIYWNKGVITTQLTVPGQYWSNFWGDVSNDGFYKRSSDYLEIVKREREGLWNVAFINHLVAIRGDVIDSGKLSFRHRTYDDINYDVGFAANARKNNVFMHVVNLKKHGHLKKMDNYTTANTHNDLWQIFTNPVDWKLNYIHPSYDEFLSKTRPEFPQPCPDVFHFPLLSRKFSWHMIHELETIPGDIFAGSGQNNDQRLAGGYENVPTVDVHFTQINFQQEWLKVLRDYVSPIQRRVFEGYSFNGNALLSFVVKYHEKGQRKLVPHHDHSTFTTNTALNRQGIDYEDGGSYFIRQNCLVRDVDIGWTLIHPGRLTHYHEGREITKGTRYILVSFNDP